MPTMLRKSTFALLALLFPAVALTQPIPVEGTEYVENEYGTTFPKEIIWEKDKSRMILIPHGTFTQGRDPAKGGTPQESPERQVTLPSFYIDVLEVSNARYMDYHGQMPAPMPRPTNADMQLQGDMPVVGIAWDAASGYARWTGRELPTEAMWERAARGPANTLYTTGNTPPANTEVIHGRALTGMPENVNTDTGDVSGWGIWHMGGNVAEYTRDYYHPNAYRDGDAVNPEGTEPSESKVVRGGHFAMSTKDIALTRRRPHPRPQISDYVGFRTVWIPTPVEQQDGPPPTPRPTPTPTRSEVLQEFIDKILPYLEKDDLSLPRELVAGRSLTNQGDDTLQFINFTPFRIYITFLGIDQRRVFKYREPVAPMSYRGIQVAKEIDLTMLAYTRDGEVDGVTVLGNTRSESKATILLTTEMFGTVVSTTNERIFTGDSQPARQIYGAFTPRWNEMEIYNSFEVPVVLKFEDILRNPNAPEPIGEYTLDGRETLRLVLPPSRYRIGGEYIGALSASSEPIDLTLDDKAARRLINLRPHRSKNVVVITEEVPAIDLELIEANRVK